MQKRTLGRGSNRGKDRGHKSSGDSRDRRKPGGGGSFGGSGRTFTGRYGRSNYSNEGPGSAPSRPAPVKVGEEYETEITDISRRGEGVAKIQGFILFVPGGKPGPEKVRLRIDRVGPRFANASLVERREESEAEESDGNETEGDQAQPEGSFDDIAQPV